MGNPAVPPPGYPAHFRPQIETLNAVSFGFIATAVLFALFFVMAIFERLLRPYRVRTASGPYEEGPPSLQLRLPNKPAPQLEHVKSYSGAVSVLMPGQEYPTYFARPIPMPLAPEGVQWPSHAESSQSAPSQKEEEDRKCNAHVPGS